MWPGDGAKYIGQVNQDKDDDQKVTFEMEQANKKKLTLLLDTGAEICMVKKGSLKLEAEVWKNKIKVRGLGGELETLAEIKARIKIGNKIIEHTFHIVDDDFPIPFDGILGVDFLEKFEGKIDYAKRNLEILGENFQIGLGPKKGKLENIMENGTEEDGELVQENKPTMKKEKMKYNNRKFLKARSLNWVEVKVKTNEEGIIDKITLQEGVHVSSCYVRPVDNKCMINIVNANEEDIEIELPTIEIEELEDLETANYRRLQTTEINKDRLKLLRETLQLDHLNKEEKEKILEICENYSGIFYLKGDNLTAVDSNIAEHTIPVKKDQQPIHQKQYRLPMANKEVVKEQIENWLDNEIIQESVSPWNFPILVVPKKSEDGKPKYRVVVDFRLLNDVTEGDAFPLPNINELLDSLGKSQYFTTIDLEQSYHQVKVKKEDREKTAFSTDWGHYEFIRMPFGCKRSAPAFQRLMNNVLLGLQGIKCLVFLDDVIIFGNSLKDHNQKLEEVFKRLEKYKLKIKPGKCNLLRKEVNYLGHIITSEGVKPDPTKIKAIVNYPRPRNQKELRSFLGLSNYYRKFIINYSKIAQPLNNLLKKNTDFNWGDKHEESFNILKERITNPPVLIYPDVKEPYVLTTDASGYAIGAILSQGPIGQDLPISYASRTLNQAEMRYSTIERELLAIVWACKHYRPYLLGAKFRIVTDHRPLTWLFSVKDPGSRLLKWRLKLEEYDYEIIYKAGKENTNADALSRIYTTRRKEKDTKDEKEQEEIEKEKKEILYECHDAPAGGHPGIKRTIAKVKDNFEWKGTEQEVEDYVKKCKECQKNKSQGKFRAPMEITDTPIEAWDKCAIDIVGPLPITNLDNKYILTFQDNFSKYLIAIPIPTQDAQTVAEKLVTEVICKYGVPNSILSDQGTNFISETFKNVCKLLKIKKIQTTSYHPQSNGSLERSHAVLAAYLRNYVNEDQSNWDLWLPYATFAYNTTPHTVTGYTPHEIIFGKKAGYPSAIKEQGPRYNFEDYMQELKEKLGKTNQIVKEKLIKGKVRAKVDYDKKTKEVDFRKGDKVLLFDEALRRGRSKKLDSKWRGPYIIDELNSKTNVTLKVGRKLLRVHKNRLKHFLK